MSINIFIIQPILIPDKGNNAADNSAADLENKNANNIFIHLIFQFTLFNFATFRIAHNFRVQPRIDHAA